MKHYPATVHGLIDAYVAARVAQYDRVNKVVRNQYADDCKHYKEGADMERPSPPSVFEWGEGEIRNAFSKFEDELTVWIVTQSGGFPNIDDQGTVDTVVIADALEGYERPESIDEDDAMAPPADDEDGDVPAKAVKPNSKKTTGKKSAK